MKNLFFFIGLLVSLAIFTRVEACYHPSKGSLHFPANFSFGVSTSAYQIEGGWNEDGKGLSIWDDFTHNYPELVSDGSNGDIAADSYHRFDEDLKILKELKVSHYRFSIAWTRIFPNGEASSRNQAGIDYYNDVIDKLVANGITPLVTIYHFDMPLEIQKKGGLISSLFIEYYVDYATEVFKSFGDRVKNWITFNEPWIQCKNGYGEGLSPPLINASGVADYLCMDIILRAHGATYRVYKSKFFEKQGGKIGISLDSQFFFTKSADTEIFNRGMQYTIGFLAHPIFSKSGGYSEVMVKDIARNSLKEGRIMSRLPTLEGKWKEIVRGSADFLGLNYYSSSFIKHSSQPVGRSPSWERDLGYEIYKEASSSQPGCDPEGLEGLLNWIRKEYNNVEVIVTENGWRDKGELGDDNRTKFLMSHLQAVLNAVNDGCNVLGYTHWSLLDNYEWIFGYTSKFGLYSVDMTSPSRERSPKKSSYFYKKVISSRISPNEVLNKINIF